MTKPCGWLSQADGSGRPDILEWSRGHVAAGRAGGGRPFVGLCHRLDRPAGGLMVIAKTSKAASRISAQFRDRTVGKIYEALCLGRPDPAEADLSQLLARDGDITRPAAEGEAGSICRLSYAVVEDGTIAELRVSRLKIDLLTGFKHQIRAQLASIGHPVYGDGRYGAPETPRGGQAIGLCSISLSLSHPIGGRALKFDCRPEDFWPFSDFKADRRAPRGAPPPGRPLD